MNTRERLETALNGGTPDVTPYAIYDFIIDRNDPEWQKLLEAGLGVSQHIPVTEYVEHGVENGLDAREDGGGDCDVNIGFPDDVPITNGRFSIVNWRPPFAPVRLTVIGAFSGNTVSGTLRAVTDFGDTCEGTWSASPR